MGASSRTRKRSPRAARDGRGFERLVGHSRALARVIEQARHVATTRATVLIEGEPGTGKGLVAQAIHEDGPRRGGPFVRVRIGSLPPGVVEAELFGSERDEADTPRRGRFESAMGGTLYLDEIGEAPEAVQIRLLRAIQERGFERAGGTETVRSDVRLIAGTQRDLSADVGAGRFREELYYRLGSVRVRMPPLRERPEDIPLLVESFLFRFNREHGRRVPGITRGALDRLASHAWPGNVRELENVVEGMVVHARARKALDLSDLPEPLRDRAGEAPRLELAVGMTVEEAERQLIAATLRYTGHDKPRAAAMLGIGLRTLYRKIQQHRIR
jgi:DNA-binding NtrC family response regulator